MNQLLIVTNKPNECQKCSGYGILEPYPWKSIECPKCFSIHVETLGLSYRTDGSSVRFHNFKFCYNLLKLLFS